MEERLPEKSDQQNTAGRVVLLSGGVGGARLARGLNQVLAPDRLTVIVNVGDDEVIYGLHVSPDLDTVSYTLAGVEGPLGWGRADDSFTVMDHLGALRVDTRFRLGDRDLATNLARTAALQSGVPLSEATASLVESLGSAVTVLPATDDPVRTRLRTPEGWLGFQEYFVMRGHRDEVIEIQFAGAGAAKPAPGVLDAIEAADLVLVAPSNPPLSIWPILAVPGVREAVAAAPRVAAVSPLFGGKALKGPADRVMESLGLPAGNAGVVAAYEGLLTMLVVDLGDARDQALATPNMTVRAADTRIADPAAAARFARWLVGQ